MALLTTRDVAAVTLKLNDLANGLTVCPGRACQYCSSESTCLNG